MAVDKINYNAKFSYNNTILQNHKNSESPGVTKQHDIPLKTNQAQGSKLNGKQIAAIYLGVQALLTFALFKKWNPKQVKKLAPHIDFIKADKVDDAVKFAKDNFGITLDVKGQLKTANWINESLVNLSNKTKGKVLLPKKIKICSIAGADGQYNPLTRTVKLSKDLFGENFEREFEQLHKSGFLNRRLLILYHEIGHGIHLTGSNMLNAILATPRYKEIINPYKNELNTFFNENSHFIKNEAETYSQLFAMKMAGIEFPQAIENIWKKFGGRY